MNYLSTRIDWRLRLVGGIVTAAMLLCFVGARAAVQNPAEQKRDAITVEGIVRDAKGEAIAGATVRVEAKDASLPAAVAETKTRADGTYTASVSAAGTYTVKAEKPGWRSGDSIALVLSAGETKRVDLVMEASAAAPGGMEFDDKPNFTVAGVTDWNNTGIHGSDVSQRTSEALVKETLSLKPGEGETAGSKASEGGTKPGGTEKEWREERERVRKAMATAETAEGHRKLGELDERLGDPLEAVREYERAALLEPSEQNYFEWGVELLLHRADEPAVEVFTKGARAHADSARMLAGLGAALYAGGNAEEAARRLCEAADLRPADAAAYLFLGKMEKAAPRVLPCSEEKLARFARERPGNALANYYYGIVLWKSARGAGKADGTRKAEELFEKAAAIDPKFGEAYLQLGILHFGKGEFQQAIREYQKAIEASPQLSEPHYRLGLAHRRVKEEAKAEQEFRVYEEMQKAETAAIENQRRELRQFVIRLKDQPGGEPKPQ